MKKLILIFAFLATTFGGLVQAQHVNVNINIGTQPAWGPVGYDYVDYYYIPDINVYYIVNSHNYVYRDGNRWITARYLPYRYRNYDLYGMYKVVLVGGPRDPWRHNSRHYNDYGRYRNHRGQVVIRDSRDVRYRDSRRNTSVWYRESSSPNRPHSGRDYQTTRPRDSNRDRDSNRENSRRSNETRPNNSSRDKNNKVGNSRSERSSNRSSSSSRSSSSRNNENNFREVNNSSRR